MEPAALGVPVFFGPHMFNFRDIAELFVENQAAVMVQNEQELAEKIRYYLGHTADMRAMTQKANALLEANRGATEKTIEVIRDICANICTI